jgi:hypothetical protein
LDGAIISKSISVFNIIAVFFAGVCALCAVVSIIGRRVGLNFFTGRTVLLTFCAAALAAIGLEATLFNYPHYYSKYNGGPVVRLTKISSEDSTIFLTSDSTMANVVDGGVVFKGLNRRVASVFVNADYKESDWVQFCVEPTDKEGTRPVCKGLSKNSPLVENYLPVHAYGEVSDLKVTLISFEVEKSADSAKTVDSTQSVSSAEGVDTTLSVGTAKSTDTSKSSDSTKVKTVGIAKLTGVALNTVIPLYFSGLRVLAISSLFFVIFLLSRREFRVRAAFYLFDYKFDPANKKQNLVYALSVAALILFSFICAYTSVTEKEIQAQQYNKYLVDALIDGRADLEAGNPEKLLKAERPYDLGWLMKNEYKPGEDWFGDWVYYKGKFYSYFGVVPALVLYVPYKLVAGNYLSNHGGIFLFAAVSIILLARLWRLLVKKYMPDARFMFYLLSFFTLFFASGLFCPLRFTRFYSIVSSAGFMFVIAGILLLFESVGDDKKADRSRLFFSCLCFALAVGCRPNLVFASLLVPFFLWKYRLWKHWPSIIVPYVLVAIPMCAYNYVRFGSIFEFGLKYNMTNLNVAAFNLATISEKIIRTYTAILSYLFNINTYSFFFPYVECHPVSKAIPVMTFYDRCCGMINFPIVLSLFYFVKSIFQSEKPKMFYISSVFLAIAAIIIFVDSWVVGVSGRYVIDFAFFIILPALFFAYGLCYDGRQSHVRQKVIMAMLAFSIFVGLALFATQVTNDATPGDPVLFRYLQQSLGLFGTV